ncbi:hypothetical protein AQJ27_46760 [Streptomyces olivochromogenes]|uniref:Uncharacterized protein n=1 Tax=Streptomyces olivochromogenes TaxID=1963 RepID=A0A250VVZ8_STROL|nr:hypothetical protein AQJ27_46760 [Streptomyces olivochromogenes]GAX58266.1 hypothetical protein SO3561_09837 [Streptomyces olivochromogenes]
MPKLAPTGRDDRVPPPPGEVLGVGPGEPVSEHGELVAANTANNVPVWDPVGESLRYFDEHHVACVVSEAVVDRFEAVEVAYEDSEAFGAVTSIVSGRLEVYVREGAVLMRACISWPVRVEPSLSDMLAKLRRVVIAARFLPNAAGQPRDAEIRAVHEAWAAASGCLA